MTFRTGVVVVFSEYCNKILYCIYASFYVNKVNRCNLFYVDFLFDEDKDDFEPFYKHRNILFVLLYFTCCIYGGHGNFGHVNITTTPVRLHW